MANIIRGGFTHTLEEVRDSLEAVEDGLGRLVGETGKTHLAPLIAEVKGLLPYDSTHRGWRGWNPTTWKARDPGHIRDSITGGVTATSFTVVTTHPGGSVHWWGGSIKPAGSTIRIEHLPGAGDDFTSREAETVAADIDRALGQLLRRHGF